MADVFDSFAIDVPYEINLPAEFTAVVMACSISNAREGETVEIRRVRIGENGQERAYVLRRKQPSFSEARVIPISLDSGRASGTITIGYGDQRPASRRFSLSERNTAALKTTLELGDFRLNVACEARGAYQGQGVHPISQEDLEVIDRTSRQRVASLASNSVLSFDVDVTEADNRAPADAVSEGVASFLDNGPSSEATGPIQQVQIPGLSEILDGE
ncbi:MAG: hypothetical protein AAFY31_01360 [Pseudomonadota bacterium]